MQTIGPYQLLEELGRGGMGVVFHGFDPAIGRPVAIKIIRASQFASALEDAEFKLRFAREAAAAGRLSHPNIVTIYQFAEEGGVRYLVQELVHGRSLEQMLSNNQPQDRNTAVSILSQVADALDYAHGEGVVHRDIKPGNILVRPDGKVKITDFGIAHIASETVTRTGVTLGTPAYMSPEQIMSARVSGKADQFSLAVTAYQMLSGKRPFAADSGPALMHQIVPEEPQPLHTVNPAVSARTSEVISRALAKTPEDRFARCNEFAERLAESLNAGVGRGQRSVATETMQAAAGGVPAPERHRRRSRVELWVASGLAVLGLAWIGWVNWPHRVPAPLAEKSGEGVSRPIERSSRSPLPEEKVSASVVADHRLEAGALQPSGPKPIANPPSKTGSPSLETGAGALGASENKQSPTLRANTPLPKEKVSAPDVADHRSEAGALPPSEPKPIVSPPSKTGSPSLETGAGTLGASENKQSPTLRAGTIKVNPKDGLTYVWIPPGTFQMGCSPGDTECGVNEKPEHQVTLTKGFSIGQTEVTQEAYRKVMGKNPSHFDGARLPVESVTWPEAQAYCHAVGMRLPTEAEWEYAARAGNASSRYGVPGWYLGTSGDTTHEVGQNSPNRFGLHDMRGNVEEWVEDWYGDYLPGAQSDPFGPATGKYKVVRGGSYGFLPRYARVSSRTGNEASGRNLSNGFRCAQTATPTTAAPPAVGDKSTSTLFSVTGLLSNGAAFNGTVLINTSTGTVSALEIIVGSPVNVTLNKVSQTLATGAPAYLIRADTRTFVELDGTSGLQDSGIIMLLPTSTLIAYKGGPICSHQSPCPGSFNPLGSGFWDPKSRGSGGLSVTEGSLAPK